MGRTGHQVLGISPALVIGVSALAVLAAGTGIALTHDDVPIARAATTLGPVRDAHLTAADGVSLPARAGQRVPNGAVVTTGPHGNAELVTRGRIVMLSGSAAEQVLDGAHQQLRTGTAVVDAQQGAGLSLDVAGDSVSVPSGSAVEADRAVTVRVGTLAGPATVTSASGRALSLPALSQTILDGDALAATATPLHLADSPDEARAVPALVSDDLALRTLSSGIDATGRSTMTTVEASWDGSLAPAPAGASLGDTVLPVVIADATAAAGGTAQDRYDHVVAWRAAGGSWGVVVHLLSGRAADVVSVLSNLQQAGPVGQVGTVSAQAIGAAPTVPLPGPTHRPTGTPTSPPPPSHHPGGGTSTPTPTPTPSSGVVGGLVNTVGGVLKSVLGLLPKQSPGPSTSTTKPAPKPTSSGLVGSLLGGLPLQK